MPDSHINLLKRLAVSYGVETAYTDYQGNRRQASPHSLLAALRALGAPVEGTSDVPTALRERALELWQRCCEPVAVTWDGNPARLELRLPAKQAGSLVECRLELEDGRVIRWARRLSRLPLLRAAAVEGASYVSRQLTLPAGLPYGYHRLELNLPRVSKEIFIFSAPRRAYAPPTAETGRIWGVFLPLYALRTRKSWGTGDLGDLGTLLRWTRKLGGGLAGTLPLLPAFLDEPFAPWPYEPVTRLFWNEFYLDIDQVEEARQSLKVRELLDSPAFREEIARLRGAPLVDYRRVMAAKRKTLEICARSFFKENSRRHAALRRWEENNPAARDYARFRAAVEKRRAAWQEWPEPMRNGLLREGDYDPAAEKYHLYVQWLASEQFRKLSAQARRNGQRLYLDLPLGVHRAGYDTWRERAAFALGASSGAPPDALFTGGQDWGFPPLHPERIREQGYRYYIACIRHHLRHAGILRLDHVAGLHRLFWIPEGMGAGEGVYVRYRAAEFYAVLALESRRRRALIVGEDLGMVPEYVRRAMAGHGIHRMYVLPFEIAGNCRQAPRSAPAGALACMNTHDMPPFAAYWKSKKGDAVQVDLPAFLRRRGWLKVPTNKTSPVLRACLAHLAAGRARILLVNLEDLWLETEPQNVPGTVEEHPNWRRKARYAFEEFSRMPRVLEVLQEIDRLRNSRQKPRSRRFRFAAGRPASESGWTNI